MQRPKTVVIILNFNGVGHLQTYLPAILSHTPQEIEVHIADNGSSDGSVAWVNAHFPEVNIYQIEKNLGYAGGYNQAIQAIDCDQVILLNSDLKVSPGYAEHLIERLQSSETIAVVQPKILSIREPEKFEYAGAAGGMIDMLGLPFCRGRMLNEVEIDQGQYNNSTPIFWASGAAFIVRKSAFMEVGGFDERFFAHQEEIDLCYRLQFAGYTIQYEPKAVVYHLGGGTLEYDSPFKLRLNVRNNLWMLLKNKPFQHLIWLLPLRLTLDGLLGISYLLKGKIPLLKAVLTAHWQFYGGWSYIMKKRSMVIRNKSEEAISGVFRSNLLWRFYIMKQRKYSDLGIKENNQ